MKDVDSIKKDHQASILNTGSPHYILPVSQLKQMDVYSEGKKSGTVSLLTKKASTSILLNSLQIINY